jgi:hypothetical protein
MGDEILKRLEALEKKVADLEAKVAPNISSQTPDLFPVPPAPEPKVPTKPMIDRWIANRKNKGLGAERSMARHAAAFTDLYRRCNGELATALVAIDRYFKDSRHWVVERGWNLDLFQKMMDGLVLEARRLTAQPSTQRVQTAPEPSRAPQTDAEQVVCRRSDVPIPERDQEGMTTNEMHPSCPLLQLRLQAGREGSSSSGRPWQVRHVLHPQDDSGVRSRDQGRLP